MQSHGPVSKIDTPSTKRTQACMKIYTMVNMQPADSRPLAAHRSAHLRCVRALV